ncbi:MAG: hypothetical protein ACYTGZ_16520, partial [Planctomycetota bacterium]
MTTMLVCLLAGALYALPDGAAAPAPDEGQKKRIETALLALRGEDPGAREVAVRDIALIGAPALPRVVARLNEADASERVLLLTAVSRLSGARSLLEQAARDPDPAVRALVAPPKREPESLTRLASRYIDLLAMTRNAKRKKVTSHMKGLKPKLARPDEEYEWMQRRLGDERMDRAIHTRYREVSFRFARAADAALRAGKLRPDLDDPVFVAFLGLLYDEEVAAVSAVTTLVGLGESVAPALLTLLGRKGHDPRVIVRILVAVGRGPDAMMLDGSKWLELRDAQIEMATRALPPEGATAFLVDALASDSTRHRKDALAGLLQLGARVPAERLLVRAKDFGDVEWTLALRLRVRAGEREALLEALAEGGVPRRGAARVLRALPKKERDAYLPKLHASEDPSLRWLAVDFTEDPKVLLEIARASEEPRMRAYAVRRAVERGDASGIGLVGTPDRALVRALRNGGFVKELVALALGEDAKTASLALRQLRHADAIGKEHEAELLKLYARLPEPAKWDALDALVPLGTPAAVKALEAAGDKALGALGVRVDDGRTIPFVFPLKRYIAKADAGALQRLGRVGGAMARLESGFFLELLDAWDKLEAVQADVEGGSSGQKVEALRQLVRASDPESVKMLFGRVLKGELTEERVVLPVLQAATRQLPNKMLSALVPKLVSEVAKYYPDKNGLPPDDNPPRDYFV